MRTVGSIDQSLINSGGKGKGGDKAAIKKERDNNALSSNVNFQKGPFFGNGSMNEASDMAPGNSKKISKMASTASSMSAEELMADPGALQKAAENGISVTGLDLEQDSDGMLAENSKQEVNKLIGNLSSSIDSEVAAMVYDQGDGQLGTNVYTSNNREDVSMEPPDNVIYDAHTHPDNDSTASQTDIDNVIPGSEATVVPADNIVGNETGEAVEYAG